MAVVKVTADDLHIGSELLNGTTVSDMRKIDPSDNGWWLETSDGVEGPVDRNDVFYVVIEDW